MNTWEQYVDYQSMLAAVDSALDRKRLQDATLGRPVLPVDAKKYAEFSAAHEKEIFDECAKFTGGFLAPEQREKFTALDTRHRNSIIDHITMEISRDMYTTAMLQDKGQDIAQANEASKAHAINRAATMIDDLTKLADIGQLGQYVRDKAHSQDGVNPSWYRGTSTAISYDSTAKENVILALPDNGQSNRRVIIAASYMEMEGNNHDKIRRPCVYLEAPPKLAEALCRELDALGLSKERQHIPDEAKSQQAAKDKPLEDQDQEDEYKLQDALEDSQAEDMDERQPGQLNALPTMPGSEQRQYESQQRQHGQYHGR